MCPVCMANAGLLAGSVVSTGGLTALVVKVFSKKKGDRNDSKTKEQGS